MPRPPPRPAAAVILAILLCLGVAGCAGPAASVPADPAGPAGLSAEAAREALARFARALEAGRWPEAWALLSPRWRAATTPERLAADWRGAGPVAREAAARAAALVAAGAPLEGAPGEVLRLPVGSGRAARLVADGGRWRVDALE